MTRAWFDHDLAQLREQQQLRTPQTLTYRDGVHAVLQGRDVTVFCSNDYLGLRNDPRIRRAAIDAIEREGVGVGASRLVSGDLQFLSRLEETAATRLGLESALFMTSGFSANVGVIPSIATSEDVLFSDALNHASIVDGCRLSKARTLIYKHLDLVDLTRAIARARPFRRGWILTESVFSMDGDVAPIAELREIADRAELGLYVDEAHGIGVLGERGEGVARSLGISPDVMIVTGGKALGGAGALVCGSTSLRAWLWNRCRSFVFSTGSSVGNAAAMLESLRVIDQSQDRLAALRANVAHLRRAVASIGLEVRGHPLSPIIPIILDTEARALALSERLLRAGFFVSAIRPPTVPRGTSRLRITVSSLHTRDEIDALVDALERSISMPSSP
jgi:8-amino-7-oxononanoate synthase